MGAATGARKPPSERGSQGGERAAHPPHPVPCRLQFGWRVGLTGVAGFELECWIELAIR